LCDSVAAMPQSHDQPPYLDNITASKTELGHSNHIALGFVVRRKYEPPDSINRNHSISNGTQVFGMISSTTQQHTDYESHFVLYPYLQLIKTTDFLLLILFPF